MCAKTNWQYKNFQLKVLDRNECTHSLLSALVWKVTIKLLLSFHLYTIKATSGMCPFWTDSALNEMHWNLNRKVNSYHKQDSRKLTRESSTWSVKYTFTVFINIKLKAGDSWTNDAHNRRFPVWNLTNLFDQKIKLRKKTIFLSLVH